MKQFSKTFAKGGIAAATVGAMALAGATPAQARGDDDGISVGEVIAYARRGNPRAAVQRCVSAAQVDARRSGYRHASVTDIRSVKDTRYGWKVRGTMVVDGQRGYRDARYDRRRDRYSARDSGKFTCYIERGRVADVDYSGIRGLR